MPRLPQSSESQPFPLPILPRLDIPVGGRLAHFVEQWGEVTHNKWVLSIVWDGFRIPFNTTPLLSSVQKSESIFLPIITRRNNRTSPETGSGKGTRSGNSWFLYLAISCPKKEWEVSAGNRSFPTKSVHKETTIQDGDSHVSKTIVIGQWLGCLHRPDRCLSTHSDSSSIREVPSVRVRRSGLPIHGLIFQNVPKSVDFYQTNGRNSSALASMCHLIISVPRWLAYKRSYVQQTSISHNILPVQSLGFIANLKSQIWYQPRNSHL